MSQGRKMSGRNPTILVVDDHEIGRITIRALLEKEGYIIHEADSGQATLDLVPELRPDVIILDAMMPGLDGFETCARLKSDPRFETTPVLMCTALTDQRDRNAGLKAGADDFLSKPVNGTELRLRISALAKVKAYHDLLENVLPRSIAKRLREEPGSVADKLPHATVLFTDLKGFVSFSKTRSAEEIVHVLNIIFSRFDQRTEEANLEKIKTIGDAYMLAGGLDSSTDPALSARNVIETGLHFFKELSAINEELGLSLSLRAGVHTGPVIGGVIGTKRLAYDIWGATVNLASRMESHGVEGHLQISEDTHQLVGNHFEFRPRGTVEVKGVGPVNTWLLDGHGSSPPKSTD